MADLTREDVIEHVRDRVSLEYADLSGLDLRGIDCRKVNFSGADLTDCRLSGSSLMEANLVQAKVSGADLSGCNVSYANCTKANFHKANLSQTNFANAKGADADFRSADLTGADFTNADLLRANLDHARCSCTDFRNAVLSEANLEGAYLRSAMFRGANLVGAKLTSAVGLDPAVAQGHAGKEIELDPPKEGKVPGIALGIRPDKAPVAYNALRPLEAGASGGGVPRKSKYHPPLRRIPAVIFTTGGWIRGVFHVPVMHGFLEHINLTGEMLKLTNVNLPYLKMELRFFGLKRNKALLVLPDCDAGLLHLPEPTADYHVHRVSFLLEGGTVTGSLAIEEDIRVSDYLANHNAFLVLRNCRFGAHDAPTEEESHFPLLLVNCGAVVGASDERISG